MARRKRRGRRLVYVPEDLIEDLVKVSKERGESVSKFVEEAIRQAIRVNEAGYNTARMAEVFEVMQAHRILGGAFVPQDVLAFLISEIYKNAGEQLQIKWYQSGKWTGKYLEEKFEDPIHAFKAFLEASRWDLSEVEVTQSERGVKVRCISSVLTTSGTDLLAKFIEGTLHGMGYVTERNEQVKGMIILEFTRSP